MSKTGESGDYRGICEVMYTTNWVRGHPFFSAKAFRCGGNETGHIGSRPTHEVCTAAPHHTERSTMNAVLLYLLLSTKVPRSNSPLASFHKFSTEPPIEFRAHHISSIDLLRLILLHDATRRLAYNSTDK